MAVLKWPAYVLRGIPADTREAMTDRALRDDMSLADVVRQAICARYKMGCDQVSSGYQPSAGVSDEMVVRLQPEVYKIMKKETANQYGATRRLILESLDDYLEVKTQ